MKVTKRLGVAPDRFFDHLEESIAYDFEQATGKKLARTRLKRGLAYQKRFNAKVGRAQGTTKVKVTQLERPRVYEATFSTAQGENSIRYTLEPVPGDAASVDVTYEESFVGEGLFNSMNYRLMAFLFSLGAQKRVKRTLAGIEAHLKSHEPDEPEE